MKIVRVFLLVLALFAVAGIAGAQPPVEEIRQRTLVAIEVNSKKFSNLLYNSKSWTELSGRQPVIHFRTPALLSHFEIVDDNPVGVLDRSEDQPPFEAQYPTLQQRVMKAGFFEHGFGDYVKDLLDGTHPIEFIGTKEDRTKRAYVLIARPSQAAVPSAISYFGKCAASHGARLMIDSETFFPIRVDVNVVDDRMCSYAVTHNLIHQVGTRLQFHCVRVSGKDPCGEIHEIYVVDRTAVTTPFVAEQAFRAASSTIAERTFRTGRGYSSLTSASVSSAFKMFLTGSCISFEGAAPRSSASSQPPVAFVQTDSYFNLDDTAPNAPAPIRSGAEEYSPSAIVGLYVREGKSGEYIALAPDGTFLLREGGKNYNGHYKVQGDTITVQGQYVPTTICRLIGHTIVEPDGSVWAKPQ